MILYEINHRDVKLTWGSCRADRACRLVRSFHSNWPEISFTKTHEMTPQ